MNKFTNYTTSQEHIGGNIQTVLGHALINDELMGGAIIDRIYVSEYTARQTLGCVPPPTHHTQGTLQENKYPQRSLRFEPCRTPIPQQAALLLFWSVLPLK